MENALGLSKRGASGFLSRGPSLSPVSILPVNIMENLIRGCVGVWTRP